MNIPEPARPHPLPRRLRVRAGDPPWTPPGGTPHDRPRTPGGVGLLDVQSPGGRKVRPRPRATACGRPGGRVPAPRGDPRRAVLRSPGIAQLEGGRRGWRGTHELEPRGASTHALRPPGAWREASPAREPRLPAPSAWSHSSWAASALPCAFRPLPPGAGAPRHRPGSPRLRRRPARAGTRRHGRGCRRTPDPWQRHIGKDVGPSAATSLTHAAAPSRTRHVSKAGSPEPGEEAPPPFPRRRHHGKPLISLFPSQRAGRSGAVLQSSLSVSLSQTQVPPPLGSRVGRDGLGGDLRVTAACGAQCRPRRGRATRVCISGWSDRRRVAGGTRLVYHDPKSLSLNHGAQRS